MDLTISDNEQQQILAEIESDDSPVGINAAKTHVLILHKLQNLEQRLEALETHLYEKEDKEPST